MAPRSHQEINQRLEHYVFSIASHFIDSVEPPTQQALIDVASRYITSATTGDAAHSAMPGNVLLDLLGQPSQQSLDQSADRRFAHRACLENWLRQQQQYQHQHVTRLENALLITRQHHQQIQHTILREPYRSRLLARCQRSMAHFQQCLDSACSVSQATANWLNRLACDKAV